MTPPSGILQHFTEVHTELLLDRFMKPSAVLVQMTPYKIIRALWVPSSQESSHSSLSQIFESPIKYELKVKKYFLVMSSKIWHHCTTSPNIMTSCG